MKKYSQYFRKHIASGNENRIYFSHQQFKMLGLDPKDGGLSKPLAESYMEAWNRRDAGLYTYTLE